MATNGAERAKRVAILIEQHVEDSEFNIPYNALRAAGAEVTVLGSRGARGREEVGRLRVGREGREQDGGRR